MLETVHTQRPWDLCTRDQPLSHWVPFLLNCKNLEHSDFLEKKRGREVQAST